MISRKSVFGFIALLACTHVQAASKFGGVSDVIGCGTAISVRNLNQAPLYTKEYEAVRADRMGSTADAAGALAGFGVVGAVAGFVGALAADTAIDANVKTASPVAPAGGAWKDVKAIKIKMDDGREINLPQIEIGNSVPGSFRFKEGQRYILNYSKDLDNIQIFIKGINLPIPSDVDKYERMCRLRIEKAVADSIIERSANLVDETKIITE